jgi:glycine cleavage system H protein
MPHPADLKYTKDHEWVRVINDAAGGARGELAEVGITDFAQHQLGDVVYVDLPAVGTTVEAGVAFGTIESVKAVSELFAPVSGTIVEVNPYLRDHPEAVNDKPHETWLVKLRIADGSGTGSLLDSGQYERLLA